MKALSLYLFLIFTVVVKAQNYDVSLIPDSLKANANAIKRYEVLEVEIKSPSKAVIRHKWAVTIFNEKGFEHSWYSNSYDQLHSLEDISGKLYESSGKQLRSIKKKEISDLSSDDNMSLMTDNRVKQFNFYYKQYPYTVEFEDEQTYYGVFHLPSWFPVQDENYAVEFSQLNFRAPSDYVMRYKAYAFGQEPVATTAKGDDKVLTWTLKNYKALEFEYFQPRLSEILPNVKLAPSEFEIQGYKGSMNSWYEFGKFRNALYAGRDELPPNIKQDIQVLTSGISSVEDKINILYDYLQKNTRYISIQLGIGGWQPFDAKFVASKKYGDCKALSNYMYALLKEAGVKASIVAIAAGKGGKGLDESFPSNQFNHIILNVPLQKDTIWLECTSQTESPGFMGSFTGNRKALMMTEEGGFVVTTPSYSAADNLQVRKVNASVDPTGDLIAEVNTRFTGEQQEEQHQLIHYFNAEQREKYLNSEISLPTYKVEKSEYKEFKGRIPMVDEYLRITAPSYASITGKRLFIQPNLFSKSGLKLNTDKPRKFPIELSMAFRDIDTMLINIPAGYQTEAVPQPVTLNGKFGKYTINFNVANDKIEVFRFFEGYKGTFPASDYTEFAKFYEDIYKADRAKVVLIKKE